jgi:hypothetical protein
MGRIGYSHRELANKHADMGKTVSGYLQRGPRANTYAQPGKPEPAVAAAPATVRSAVPITQNTSPKQASTAELTKTPIKPFGVRGTTPLDPDDTLAQPPTKNQAKITG